MESVTLAAKDFAVLLEAAAQRGAELALDKFNKPILLSKGAALELLGIKAHATLRKLAASPGFPLPVRGKYNRSELERWLDRRSSGEPA